MRSLEESGVELTSDMIGRLDYLKTKKAGLDVKLVHTVPSTAIVPSEQQAADIKKAKEIAILLFLQAHVLLWEAQVFLMGKC